MSLRLTSVLRPNSSVLRTCPSHMFGRIFRATLAVPASETVSGFRIPRTEREVAELLANAKSDKERKKIFEALIGIKEIVSKVPSKPRGHNEDDFIPIGRTKSTTDQTGVDVHHSPFKFLEATFEKTLKVLEKLPAATVYRQAVESITRDQLQIIKKYVNAAVPGEGADVVEARVKAAETELGVVLIEKAIEQAEDEYDLALKMIDFKGWENLQEKPAQGQWDYFPVPPSTSYPKN
ncbi:hypothetical protein O181_075498 [Austropuccinia psidii MF-1]|uniref:NADH dehydrogenase [ubiquinone] 1 alpha subcomplex subunit 5 n=1 Tax=Austropuccinia psidii MF-1 TaxID=1389203 RepID=A0A9Q3FD58_9BASI|nr:hypothetical protein [Austropuccinia psidii MF-1]